MCVKPEPMWIPQGPDFVQIMRPCRKCWACKKNRVNDLVAKCLLEMLASDWSVVLTLTYDDKKRDPGREQHQLLDPYDFKRFMARLRRKFTVRYLAAGEYGKRKGRAHWHVCLFGVGLQPEIVKYKQRESFKAWPWGFTYAEDVNFKSLEYVAKYLVKGDDTSAGLGDDARHERVSYSTRPPMGLASVLALADRYVAERVFPRTFRINIPNAPPRRFSITGVSQMLFLERIFTQWPESFDQAKTEWMANAQRRYVRWRASRQWALLDSAEQQYWLDESIRPGSRARLSTHNMLWQDYLEEFGDVVRRDQEALQRWLDVQARGGIAAQIAAQLHPRLAAGKPLGMTRPGRPYARLMKTAVTRDGGS